jgi:HEAT repeat protein
MLAFFLVASNIVYYLQNARVKLRAAAIVAGILAFGVLSSGNLSQFKKATPQETSAKQDLVDMFLKELASDSQASQLDGLKHLQEMNDPRIVPALDSLLARTQSDEVVESTVTALSKQKDARAIPALRKAAAGIYDYFLKLTIAEAQFNVGDTEGFSTLIGILEKDDAGYARHQAIDLLEAKSGKKFGYNPDTSAATNQRALAEMIRLYSSIGSRLKFDANTSEFHE